MTYHLAIDIGASSGRHILGWVEDGRMHLKEVYRFENRLAEKNGHRCWEMDRLWQNVQAGLKACKDAGCTPETVGIDTWAVDFVLLDAAGKILGDILSVLLYLSWPISQCALSQSGSTGTNHDKIKKVAVRQYSDIFWCG